MTDEKNASVSDLLDPMREVGYDELCEEFGAERIDADLRQTVLDRVTELYDRRETLRQQLGSRSPTYSEIADRANEEIEEEPASAD